MIFTDTYPIIGNQRYVTIYFASIANLKCTPSGRQMYPQGYMYPRLGTSTLNAFPTWLKVERFFFHKQ